MHTVISVIKNKVGGEETQVSTGFANRGEASRFAVGLAKTGKTVRVDIREDPDPTLLETLLSWRKRIERTDAALPEEIHKDIRLRVDIERAIAAVDGEIKTLLTLAYNYAHDKADGSTLADAPEKYEFLETVTKALEAYQKIVEKEKGVTA